MSDELTSTAGVVALVAGGIALIALLLAVYLAFRLRALQSAQRQILGDTGERDLVAHANALQQGFDALHSRVENTASALSDRLAASEQRLERSISRSCVVRYDAYNELSGRQSSSIALIDETGTGVVMSSILHRDQARLYAKGVQRGVGSDIDLSPEESEAVKTALAAAAPAEQS